MTKHYQRATLTMFIGIDDVAFKEMKLIKSKLKPKRTIVEQNKIKQNVVRFSNRLIVSR